MRVGDLDMLPRRATISENAVQPGKQIYIGNPKAHKQWIEELRRHLPVLDHLDPVVGVHRR